MRQPRWLPPDNLYEVTLKTFQNRYFFVPCKRLNELLIGVLAYTQAKFGLGLCFVVLMTTHVHLLIARRCRAQSGASFRDTQERRWALLPDSLPWRDHAPQS